MRLALTLFFTFIIIFTAQSKELKYPTLLIPDSLKKNAYAIIRNEQVDVNVISLTKCHVTLTKVITILNSNGKQKGWEAYSYDANKKIINISAKMYNAFGIEVNKWNRKDWEDVSYDSYGTTYSETRMLFCKPIKNSYPYTIEYKVTYERNNTYMIDGWHPIWENNLAIQKSTFTLSHPADLKIKFKEYNFSDKIEKSTNELTTIWELNNLSATKSEPYKPSRKNLLPYIKIDAYDFSYDGYNGKSGTWKDFGAFIGQLNEERFELPENRKQEIDTIIATCTDNFSKIEALYKYMQSHTRYVNISIGIGGIQTLPAETVSKNGYGDCKALSNYMYAMLKYAGIKSYFTLINAGAYNYDFDESYVGHQFNHAILCVPMAKDTIWLECTSQTSPCGFLGDFTDNRQVLLITENGGVLSKTPKYGKNVNKIVRKANVNVTENGDCKANLISCYTGLEYDDKHRLTTEDKEEQLKMLYADYDIPNFKIENFNLDCESTRHPKLNEELNFSLPSYASKSGSRLFLPVNLVNKWSYVPRKLNKRTFEIHMKSEYCNSDSIAYSVPENFNIEVVPDSINIESKYGKYKSETTVIDNQIIYNRYFELNCGKYPAEEYDEFIAFFKKIKKNDNAKAILKRNE